MQVVDLSVCYCYVIVTYCLSDEDESASGSAQYHANTDCLNTVGSYGCTCKAGYNGDGLVCASKELIDDDKEAPWPSGQGARLEIRRWRVHVPLSDHKAGFFSG